jgi:hypothetical protein
MKCTYRDHHKIIHKKHQTYIGEMGDTAPQVNSMLPITEFCIKLAGFRAVKI